MTNWSNILLYFVLPSCYLLQISLSCVLNLNFDHVFVWLVRGQFSWKPVTASEVVISVLRGSLPPTAAFLLLWAHLDAGLHLPAWLGASLTSCQQRCEKQSVTDTPGACGCFPFQLSVGWEVQWITWKRPDVLKEFSSANFWAMISSVLN